MRVSTAYEIISSVARYVLLPSHLCPSQCYKREELNVQCPVCSKPFNDLVKPLPFAHCSQSYLICTLSGKPMDEHNPPMALPNGYIYGEQVTRLG